MKVLITDGWFPNKYASWRNVEILSFLQEFKTTVLVHHGKRLGDLIFNIDWDDPIYDDIRKIKPDLKFLIFDPKFNYLNKYNNKFDGTKFNGHLSHYSYALTEDFEFDLGQFDVVYHIFAGGYYDFNRFFDFDNEKQFIHLYPGGGFLVLIFPQLIEIWRSSPHIQQQINWFEEMGTKP